MAIEAVDTRARGLRDAPRGRGRSASAACCAGSTGCCCSRSRAVVGYGLWAIDGITHARPRRLGGLAPGGCTPSPARCSSSVVLFIDPDTLPAAAPADLLRDARRDAVRARRGRGDARLAALDQRRLLHVPAVRVRQGAVRARARRLPRRPRRGRSTLAGAPLARDRLRARADRARLRAAGHRHRARLHRRARRGALRRRRALVASRRAAGADRRLRRSPSSGCCPPPA